MQAACAQYSNVVGFFAGQYAFSTRVPPDRPEPRVRDELVRPGEHRDRVKLHGADPPQHPGHAAAPRAGPEETLRVKGDPPHLVGAQFGCLPRGRPLVPHGCLTGGRASVVPGVRARCCFLIIPNGCG